MFSATRDILQTALLALLIFMVLQGTIQNYRVEGSSMNPTLQDNQYLLANKVLYYHLDKARLARWLVFIDSEEKSFLYPFHPPSRGEVVVFRYPGDESRHFVKRVIGVPGDKVQIRGGKVYLNNTELREPYVVGSSNCFPPKICQSWLSDGEYFVLGDNRQASNDSRDWGPVPMENVVGRAWVTYWPFSEAGFLP